MELKTIQDTFIDVYFASDGDTDIMKYTNAVRSFERAYSIKAPYNDYRSFKSTMSFRHRTKFKNL